MSRTLKIILITSITLNVIFVLSLGVIGVKALSFKHHWEELSHDDDEHHYKKRGHSHEHKQGRKHGLKKLFSFLKEDEDIKNNFRELRSLKNEMRDIVDEDGPLDMEKVELLLNQLESNITNTISITHQKLIENLNEMSDEEREESVKFFLKKSRF